MSADAEEHGVEAHQKNFCGPHPHFPDSPRSRAQCWGTEELASTASFSLVRLDQYPTLCNRWVLQCPQH